jgi:hypothetical protein
MGCPLPASATASKATGKKTVKQAAASKAIV